MEDFGVTDVIAGIVSGFLFFAWHVIRSRHRNRDRLFSDPPEAPWESKPRKKKQNLGTNKK